MHLQQIHTLLQNPENILGAKKNIEAWRKEYPQSSSVQLLYTKLLQQSQSSDYKKALKMAAIVSPNREALYHFVIAPQAKTTIEKVDQEIESTEAVELSNENIEEKAEIKSESVSNEEATIKTANAEEGILTENTQEEETKIADLTPEVTNKGTSGKTKDSKSKQELEREILNQAISASIYQDVDYAKALDTNKTLEKEIDQAETIEEAEEKKLPENYEQLGVLEWLQFSDEATDKEVKSSPEQSKADIIDSFIKKDPQRINIDDNAPTLIPINRPKQEFFSPENMAKMSLMEDEDFVTETLAGIYAKQGNISKAKKAYQKLSLKFPEKSNYFARLIQKLDNKD